MIDPDNVPEVADGEVLARYILAGQTTKSLRKYVREDDSVKPELFLPYQHVELSVNRHRDCDEAEVWGFGRAVANFRQMKLHGRCDLSVADCRLDTLSVVKRPIKDDSRGVPDNPNHADIVGFPPKKEDQKSLAQKLAAKATKRMLPP